MIDFTFCPVDKTANYGGSDKKRGIFYNGVRYMLKLSNRISEDKRNDLNSSYTNSAFSEYLGCHIIASIGLEVQETLLGTMTLMSSMGVPRVYPVVACKNFVAEGYSLVEFKNIEDALLDHKATKIPKIVDVYAIFTNDNPYFSGSFAKEVLANYWDIFIVDALLGNFDRHANNWGYLINNQTQKMEIAPIYDCGSCLYPQLADDALEHIISNDNEIQMRIDKFPLAALEGLDGRKISYKTYINSFINDDCTAALERIFPRIDMGMIDSIIDETDGLSDIRRSFYKVMLHARYSHILESAYTKLQTSRAKPEKLIF